RHADAIIVAEYTQVEMTRIAGKPVKEVYIGKAIQEASVLLNRAIKQDASIYEHDVTKDHQEEEETRTGFYKHLMNGVSNMLPFVVGGGILIVLSFFCGMDLADPNS